MKLDKTFENEVYWTANGYDSTEYRYAMIEQLKEVSVALSNRYEFENCIQKYGRAKVALCVAATIHNNSDRYENTQILWAEAVMKEWTNRNKRSLSAAIINIHPAILATNSINLRKLTEVKI